MSLDIRLTIDVDTGNKPYSIELFEATVTGNFVPVWQDIGVYDALYLSSGKKAGEIIDVLDNGIWHITNDQDRHKNLGYRKFELEFLKMLREACNDYPNSIISCH
jgi:hypothetical protein